MKNRSMRFHSLRAALATAAFACVACSVHAATDWSASFGSCSLTTNASTGWSKCATDGPELRAVVTATGSGSSNGGLVSYGSSGLGANWENGSDGPHSIDSYSGIDAIVLNFSNFANPVSLDSFSIGWNGTDNWFRNNGIAYNDSDISVYRWIGNNSPTTGSEFNKSNSGWEFVSQHMNVGEGDNTESLPKEVYSSYWLISALGNTETGCLTRTATRYNPAEYGACVDAFKLLSVAGNFAPTNETPEPGSIALLGLGAAGLLAARRKSVVRR